MIPRPKKYSIIKTLTEGHCYSMLYLSQINYSTLKSPNFLSLKELIQKTKRLINKQLYFTWHVMVILLLISGKVNLLKRILKYDFNLNENDYMNQTPLFYSAKEGQVEASQILIENGCDVNHKDVHGQTSLFYAARYGQLAICKLLAKHNCNMLHQDKNRVKASHFARI